MADGNILRNSNDSSTDGGSNSILSDESGDHFNLLRGVYESKDKEGNDPDAAIEGVGPVPGAYSLFNPFHIFRYSKYGMNKGDYKKEYHLDSQGASNGLNSVPVFNVFKKILGATKVGSAVSGAVEGISQAFKSFDDSRQSIENPTASEIIRWASKAGIDNSDGATSPVPYTSSDFLWCKYYGKVPNNRLVTLRRFAMPIEDNLLIHKDKAPLVPIAQAVTWYGNDIGNKLNNILNLNWGLNWKNLPGTTVSDVTGNEITLEQIANATGLSGAENEKLLKILKTQIFTDGTSSVDLLKLSGYDTSIQEYIKASYGENGPYWNRILGPVNVINETRIRDRGFKSQKPISLTFEYSLRAYGGINPKIAFLDLLGNFLSLTHNTAPFWGGGLRYFEKTGVTVPALAMENKFLDGDVAGAIQQGLEQISQQANANLESLVKLAQDIGSGLVSGDQIASERDKIKTDIGRGASPLEKLITPRLGQLLRKPLIYRSILDGRAVGEWHLTIGNPMNPMAMMGNLCVEDVKMEVGDTLGIDDFPTEFKFTVTLQHGRPRAKQDIESIFNLGNGAMTFSQLPQPSSARQSYGAHTTAQLNSAYEGKNIDSPEALSKNPSPTSNKDLGNSAASSQDVVLENGNSLEGLVAQYSRQVGRMYGEGFGKSPILVDYFKELKTKD